MAYRTQNNLLQDYLARTTMAGRSAYGNTRASTPSRAPQTGSTNKSRSVLLEDEEFVKSIIDKYSEGTHIKPDKKPKANALDRLFAILGFDLWSPTMTREVRGWTDDKGKRDWGGITKSALKAGTGAILGQYLLDGGKRVAGGITGNPDWIDTTQDGDMGKEFLREVVGYGTMASRGFDVGKLGSKNWQDTKDTITREVPDFMQGITDKTLDIHTGVGGFAADMITPAFFMSGKRQVARTAAAGGQKVFAKAFKETAKSTGKAVNSMDDFIKIAGKGKARKLAEQALKIAKVPVDEKTISKVLKSTRILNELAEKSIEPGLYTGRYMSMADPQMQVKGALGETAGRYIENPLFAGAGDAWKVMNKLDKGMGSHGADFVHRYARKPLMTFAETYRHGGGKPMRELMLNVERGLKGGQATKNYEARMAMKALDLIAENSTSPLKTGADVRKLKQYITGDQYQKPADLLEALVTGTEKTTEGGRITAEQADAITQRLFGTPYMSTSVEGIPLEELGRILSNESFTPKAIKQKEFITKEGTRLKGAVQAEQRQLEKLIARQQKLTQMIEPGSDVARPKIISGGQTGADLGGLQGAKAAGLETGGTAPRGWRTERGVDPTLKDFGLVESKSANYTERTIDNIKNSDATVIFAKNTDSPGTRQTIKTLKELKKPYIINPDAKKLREWARGKSIINVAGNRESKMVGGQKKVAQILEEAFKPAKTVDKITPMKKELERLTAEIDTISKQFTTDTTKLKNLEEALGGIRPTRKLIPGADNFIQATEAYQQEVTAQSQLMDKFTSWIEKAAMPKEDKVMFRRAIDNMQKFHKQDWGLPQTRKGFLDNLSIVQKHFNRAADVDTGGKELKEAFDRLFFRPMKEQVSIRMAYDKANEMSFARSLMGERGAGASPAYSKGIYDTPDKIAPFEVREVNIGGVNRKTFINDATLAAYNKLSDSPLKLMDDVQSHAESLVGAARADAEYMGAVHGFYTQLLARVQDEGNEGMMIARTTQEKKQAAELGYELIGANSKHGLPIFDNAGIYIDRRIAEEVREMLKIQIDLKKREPMGHLMQGFLAFNNMWKGVQTGGGINIPLPKALKNWMDNSQWESMKAFSKFYDENVGFLPFSPAFTTRNIINNWQMMAVRGNMSMGEIVTGTLDGLEVMAELRRRQGKPPSLGMGWGALIAHRKRKGTALSRRLVKARADEITKSGLLEGSYFQTEYLRSADEMIVDGEASGVAKWVANYGENERSQIYNENIEMANKIGLFYSGRKKGYSALDSTALAEKVLFNYGDATKFEKGVVKPLTVFYIWQKKNVELMAWLAQNEPNKFKAYARLVHAGIHNATGTDFTEEELAALPAWSTELASIPLRTKDGDISVISGFNTNLEAAVDWSQAGKPTEGPRALLTMMAPTWRMPIEMTLDYQGFTGDKITEDTSAYTYRAMPKAFQDMAGISDFSYTTEDGEERTTLKMDGRQKYLMQNLMGRPTGNIAKWSAIAVGKQPRLAGTIDMLSGMKYNTYDTEYLVYKHNRQKYEESMKKLQELGIARGHEYFSIPKRVEEIHPGILEDIDKWK